MNTAVPIASNRGLAEIGTAKLDHPKCGGRGKPHIDLACHEVPHLRPHFWVESL